MECNWKKIIIQSPRQGNELYESLIKIHLNYRMYSESGHKNPWYKNVDNFLRIIPIKIKTLCYGCIMYRNHTLELLLTSMMQMMFFSKFRKITLFKFIVNGSRMWSPLKKFVSECKWRGLATLIYCLRILVYLKFILKQEI